MSGHMDLFMMEDNGFIYDGRQSYIKVSVNYFVLLLHVLTMFLLFLKHHIDGSEAWFGSNFHTKGMLKLPIFWEWNYIENVLIYFSMEKCKPVMYLLIKGMILCEELYLNS